MMCTTTTNTLRQLTKLTELHKHTLKLKWTSDLPYIVQNVNMQCQISFFDNETSVKEVVL